MQNSDGWALFVRRLIMNRLLLASVLASGGVLPFACSPPSDSAPAPVSARESSRAGHYVFPVHGNLSFSSPIASGGTSRISTDTPLESMLDFFEGTSLGKVDSQKILDAHNIRWGVSKPVTLSFVSGSFMYGSPWESDEDPDPQGSYTRSDLVSSNIVPLILEGRRPATEFYPVTGDFATLTRQGVKDQLPAHPVYMVPGDMVAKATNMFPSGTIADVSAYNDILVANVNLLAAARPDSAKNLTALLRDAQEAEGIGRHKPVVKGDRFRTYNLLNGQFGVITHDTTGAEHVYALRFNGQKLLYPVSADSSPEFMQDTLSKRGVDSAPTYCGRDVDIRYLK